MRLWLLLVAVWAVVRTLFRRVLVGPLVPSWTLRMELVLEVMRALLHTVSKRDVAAWRRVESMLDTSANQWPAIRTRSADIPGVNATWFEPPNAGGTRALLYFHGGGYVFGSIQSHRDIINRLARDTGVRVLAVDYRLAPEHPHPAALDDARAAYGWLLQNGVAPKELLVAGDSAGGGLVVALLMALRDGGVPLPCGAVCFSPWLDLAATAPSIRLNERTDYLPAHALVRVGQMYAGTHSVEDPHVSPLNGEARGLPPLLLQAGGAEILLDDAVRFEQKARAAGVDVTLQVDPDMFHVPAAFAPLCTPGRAAMGRAVTWMTQRLGAASSA